MKNEKNSKNSSRSRSRDSEISNDSFNKNNEKINFKKIPRKKETKIKNIYNKSIYKSEEIKEIENDTQKIMEMVKEIQNKKNEMFLEKIKNAIKIVSENETICIPDNIPENESKEFVKAEKIKQKLSFKQKYENENEKNQETIKNMKNILSNEMLLLLKKIEKFMRKNENDETLLQIYFYFITNKNKIEKNTP